MGGDRTVWTPWAEGRIVAPGGTGRDLLRAAHGLKFMSRLFWNSPFYTFGRWLTAGHRNHGKQNQEPGGPRCRSRKKKDGRELANDEPRDASRPPRLPPVSRHWGRPGGVCSVTPSHAFRPPSSPPSHTACSDKGRRWAVCTFNLPSTKTVAQFPHASRLGPAREDAPCGSPAWATEWCRGEASRLEVNKDETQRILRALRITPQRGRVSTQGTPLRATENSRCLLRPGDGRGDNGLARPQLRGTQKQGGQNTPRAGVSPPGGEETAELARNLPTDARGRLLGFLSSDVGFVGRINIQLSRGTWSGPLHPHENCGAAAQVG